MTEPFRIVIPARMASSRLPGKPLLELGGKPMIAHVLARALEAGAAQVVVATEDPRIEDVVRRYGGQARLTSAEHASGTDRLAEVAELEGFGDDDIIVNLQGDEPFVPAALLAMLATRLREHPDCGLATAATPIASADELFNPNAVKVTLDQTGRALTFSRAPIPWVRGLFTLGFQGALPEGVPFLRHLGLYAYRARTLKVLARAPQSALEVAESLEQLRALHLGLGIHVVVLDEAPVPGIDTPEDLARAEQFLRASFTRAG